MNAINLEVGGFMVMWRIAPWTKRSSLSYEFSNLGLEEFIPEPRPDSANLRDALNDVFRGKEWEVVPLKDRISFEVVRLTKQEFPEGNHRELYCTVQAVSEYLISWSTHVDQRYDVEAKYLSYRGLISQPQLSKSVVNILDSWKSVSVRPGGGVYWLPATMENRLSALEQALECSSSDEKNPSRFYSVKNIIDHNTMKLVRDGLLDEVEQACSTIEQEIEGDEIGERALKSRVRALSELDDKIRLYQEILREGMDDLLVKTTRVQEQASHAILMAQVADLATV